MLPSLHARHVGPSSRDTPQPPRINPPRANPHPRPPAPQDRKPGPKFEALSDEEAQRERLMASLSASGMSGQLFDRASLKEQMEAFGGGDAGDLEGLGGGPGGGPGGAEGLAGKLQEGVAAARDAVAGAAGAAGEAVAGAAGAAAGLIKGALGKITGGGGGEEL
jgi:uncharacterized protein YjbJ (UPF0337 family)